MVEKISVLIQRYLKPSSHFPPRHSVFSVSPLVPLRLSSLSRWENSPSHEARSVLFALPALVHVFKYITIAVVWQNILRVHIRDRTFRNGGF